MGKLSIEEKGGCESLSGTLPASFWVDGESGPNPQRVKTIQQRKRFNEDKSLAERTCDIGWRKAKLQD